MPKKKIYWFEEIESHDSHHIGERGVKLAELKNSGVSIPDGFVISSNAFDEFLKDNMLEKKAKHLISTANLNDPNSLKQISDHIYKNFHDGEFNSEFIKDLYSAYKKLGGIVTDTHVKIIPSTAYHIHSHKPEVHDELKGEASLLQSIKDYWASNFSEMNILNTTNDAGFTKSLIVQRSIEPEKSGKIYTIDPENYDKEILIIKSMLGHYNEMQNLASLPDYYVINKKEQTVVEKREHIQKKATKKVGGEKKTTDISKKHHTKKKLTEKQLEKLINEAKLTEKLSYFPQEIDWIAEGQNIYIVHTKPLTHTN